MGFVPMTQSTISLPGMSVREALAANLVACVPQSEEIYWAFPVLAPFRPRSGQGRDDGPLIVGTFIAGTICAFVTGCLSDNNRVRNYTAMGVISAGMFAVGMINYTSIRKNEHLDLVVSGNMLGIGPDDITTSLWILGDVTLVLLAKWRDIQPHAFDPAQAKASGLTVGVIHDGLLVILSRAIVSTLSPVGLVLAIALLITPGSIAFLVVQSFGG